MVSKYNSGVVDVEYSGVIVEDLLLFVVNKRMYVCSKNKYEKPREISNNSRILAVKNRSVYFERVDLKDNGVIRKAVYRYFKGDIKLCKVEYANK